jgi:hypothetical protein
MSSQGGKKVCGVVFEKAVRRKPLARRTRDLWKLNGAKEGCRSSQESSRPVEEEPVHVCKDESWLKSAPSRRQEEDV